MAGETRKRVALVIHDGKGKVLVGRHRKAPKGTKSIAFPGGGVEKGQSVAVAAKQEALEEVGVRIKPQAVGIAPKNVPLPNGGKDYKDGRFSHIRQYWRLARYVGKSEKLLGEEGDALRSRRFIGIDQAIQAIQETGSDPKNDNPEWAKQQVEALNQVRKFIDKAAADPLRLIEKFGPPSQWSGASAAAMGPENRRTIIRAWKSLSSEERKTLKQKFCEGMDRNLARMRKTARAETVLEGVLMVARKPHLAAKYKGLQSNKLKKLLKWEIPGTKGIGLSASKVEALATRMSHPEGLLSGLLPGAVPRGIAEDALKARLPGAHDKGIDLIWNRPRIKMPKPAKSSWGALQHFKAGSIIGHGLKARKVFLATVPEEHRKALSGAAQRHASLAPELVTNPIKSAVSTADSVAKKTQSTAEALKKYASIARRLSKEKRQAYDRADALHRSDEPEKWDNFIQHASRKSFAKAIAKNSRSDDKLILHADRMNRLLTGRKLDTVRGKTGTYDIIRLRGGGYGCTCNDWRYRRSVASKEETDCRHLKAWRFRRRHQKEAGQRTAKAPQLRSELQPHQNAGPGLPLWLSSLAHTSHNVHRPTDHCHLCKKSMKGEPFYMAKEDVWLRQANMRATPNDPVGGPFLHLKCLQKKLSRALVREDFKKAVPCNRWIFGRGVHVAERTKKIAAQERYVGHIAGPSGPGKLSKTAGHVEDRIAQRAPSKVVELTSPKHKRQAIALETKVFRGPTPDTANHRTFGIFEGGKLVAMTRVNTRPLDGWKKDSAYDKLKALAPEVGISATAVDPDYRGRGYATGMKTHLQGKYSRIMSGTGPKSHASMPRINERLGFRPVLASGKRGQNTQYFWSDDSKQKTAGHVEDRAAQRAPHSIKDIRKLRRKLRGMELRPGATYYAPVQGGYAVIGDVGQDRPHHVVKTVLRRSMTPPGTVLPGAPGLPTVKGRQTKQADIEPGDVLLVEMSERRKVKGAHKMLFQDAYRTVSPRLQGSRLTHAAMYVGNDEVVEARAPAGVKKVKLKKAVGDREFTVLRPRTSVKRRLRAADAAKDMVGTPYSYGDMMSAAGALVLPTAVSRNLKSGKKKLTLAEQEAVQCGALIGGAYAATGVDLHKDIHWKSLPPSKLLNNKKLRAVKTYERGDRDFKGASIRFIASTE